VPQIQAQDEPIDEEEPAEPAEPDEEEEPSEPAEPSGDDEGGTDAIAPKLKIRSIRRA
jgi:hypothetical protein